MARKHDLFLSYNSRDQDAVRQIHEALKRLGLHPWFDREALTPGRLWQEEAEKGLKSCRAAAVFVGPSGIGPWENLEMRVLLTRVAQEGLPLIPVPLPGAPEKLELPRGSWPSSPGLICAAASRSPESPSWSGASPRRSGGPSPLPGRPVSARPSTTSPTHRSAIF